MNHLDSEPMTLSEELDEIIHLIKGKKFKARVVKDYPQLNLSLGDFVIGYYIGKNYDTFSIFCKLENENKSVIVNPESIRVASDLKDDNGKRIYNRDLIRINTYFLLDPKNPKDKIKTNTELYYYSEGDFISMGEKTFKENNDKILKLLLKQNEKGTRNPNNEHFFKEIIFESEN